MSERLTKLEERVSKLEEAANPGELKWAGTMRCAKAIIAIASDISGETITDIEAKHGPRRMVTVRAAAAVVMTGPGGLTLELAGMLMGNRDHSSVSRWVGPCARLPEVAALSEKILEEYRKGPGR